MYLACAFFLVLLSASSSFASDNEEPQFAIIGYIEPGDKKEIFADLYDQLIFKHPRQIEGRQTSYVIHAIIGHNLIQHGKFVSPPNAKISEMTLTYLSEKVFPEDNACYVGRLTFEQSNQSIIMLIENSSTVDVSDFERCVLEAFARAIGFEANDTQGWSRDKILNEIQQVVVNSP
tara:strand:+ start:186 stop:713 length:528 start_codon:yes stop_codon:yes gene_type:complete